MKDSVCLLERSILICNVCIISLLLICFSPFLLSHKGDGANDVSMIQVADIGIGISGQEGMQVSGCDAPKFHELDLPIQGNILCGNICVVLIERVCVISPGMGGGNFFHLFVDYLLDKY